MRAAAAAAGLALLAGCGYHGLGGARLFGQHRVAVLPFEEAAPAGLAGALARQLQRRLSSGGLHLAATEDDADAVLDGELVPVTLPHATRAGIVTYQVGISARAELRGRGGDRLWQAEVSGQEDYLPAPPGSQPARTEAARRAALGRLADSLAAELAELLRLHSHLAAGA